MSKEYKLILNNCVHCPANWADVECLKTEPYSDFGDSDNPLKSIPPWCPLPDAKEKTE